MSVEIRTGDCRQLIKSMPDESVHCVVTSPPYWGLRSYLPDGHPDKVHEIGLEPTLGEHLSVLVSFFREVRRVLRKDGTCWINYGDCYATTPNGRSAKDTKAAGNDDRTFRDKPFSTIGAIYRSNHEAADRRGKNGNKGAGDGSKGRVIAGGYLKPKDLCMIPNRLAIALQDDGWWVRSEIIWAKPNPMPESITDRPAGAHEKMFLLTKSQKYWYDAEAVKRPMAAASVDRLQQDVENQTGSFRQPGKTNGPMKAVGSAPKGNAKTFRGGNYANGVLGERDSHGNEPNESGLVNLRNVWTIATAAYSDAHFATFPPALVEPCLKAGCPIGGTVLDPFGGSGTVGMVADRLQRNAILFELNPDGLAERRIKADAGMFLNLKVS